MKDEDPWTVMQSRQPIWTIEDEILLAQKKIRERLRYANLPENETPENDEEEDE
jgi:hypothetical protein